MLWSSAQGRGGPGVECATAERPRRSLSRGSAASRPIDRFFAVGWMVIPPGRRALCAQQCPRATGAARLLRATLTLLAGGVLAQALPLLLGPLADPPVRARRVRPLHGVRGGGGQPRGGGLRRYDFALPLARDETEARDLMALCLRVLVAVTLFTVAGGRARRHGCARYWCCGCRWPWRPPAPCRWLTLWATRAQRFAALSAARFMQYGGGARAGWPAQPERGLVGPDRRRPRRGAGGGRRRWRLAQALAAVPRAGWLAAARRHREFPLLNTPHAFAGALQDTLAVALIAACRAPAAAGFWGLALRYLKAPASLVGGAVSQALYPALAAAVASPRKRARGAPRDGHAGAGGAAAGARAVAVRPAAFAAAFGEPWREAGELARALAPYIGVHFVASPLAVVTMAWRAQAWALKLALVGQAAVHRRAGLGPALWRAECGAAGRCRRRWCSTSAGTSGSWPPGRCPWRRSRHGGVMKSQWRAF